MSVLFFHKIANDHAHISTIDCIVIQLLGHKLRAPTYQGLIFPQFCPDWKRLVTLWFPWQKHFQNFPWFRWELCFEAASKIKFNRIPFPKRDWNNFCTERSCCPCSLICEFWQKRPCTKEAHKDDLHSVPVRWNPWIIVSILEDNYPMMKTETKGNCEIKAKCCLQEHGQTSESSALSLNRVKLVIWSGGHNPISPSHASEVKNTSHWALGFYYHPIDNCTNYGTLNIVHFFVIALIQV